MANKYEQSVLGFPTIAVVMEDSIWEFGKKKEKAKINIPAIMPLQEPSSAVKFVTKHKKGKLLVVPETQNYIELFLPDDLYTFPVEGGTKINPKSGSFGNKVTHGSGSAAESSSGGSKGTISGSSKAAKTKKKSLYRIVEKDTKLVIIVIDGYAVEENIKILFKYDDFDENNMGAKESGHHGLSTASKNAALR